jgi:peptidoglycan/xylan/chitin deacetylase (PgdA/CDA1 family)
MRAVGLDRLARRRYGRVPTILTYHGVHDGSLPTEHARYSTKHVHVDDFRRQLVWLRRHFEVVSLAQVENEVRTGSLPTRRAAVTFDDGYENNLSVAWPILREMGIPATFFVTVDVVERQRPYDHDRVELVLRCTKQPLVVLSSNGRRVEYPLGSNAERSRAIYDMKAWLSRLPDEAAAELRRQLIDPLWEDRFLDAHRIAYQPLTWPQVRRLADEGAEIGSHTLSHPHLARADDDRVRHELAESRRILAERIGRPVVRLSYPHGSYDPRVKRMAAEAGYVAAYTSRTWIGPGPPDPFELPRISVNGGAPFGLFVVAASRALHLVGRGSSGE